MRSIPLASVSSLAPFFNYLSANGGDPFQYSDAAQIPREMMETLDGRIAKIQANKFLELAHEREGISDLGYRVGQSYGPMDMSSLGEAILSSTTLGEALQTFCKHINTWWGGMDAWIEKKNTQAWIKIRPVDGLKIPRNVSNQNGIFIFANIIRLAAGKNWVPKRMIIPPTPNNSHENFPIVGEAEVFFDPEVIGLEFPAMFLPLTLNATPLQKNPGALIPHPPTLVDSLYEIVQNLIRHDHVPGITTVAEIIQSTPRTLQRRLVDSDINYRQLVNRARIGLARDALLINREQPLEDISKLSGFANARSLIFSFKRSTGITPGEFRRLNQQDAEGYHLQ